MPDDADIAPPALEVRHVAKRFGAVTALADASLACRAREIHAIMGANGAGKSTFVKVVSGVHRPDAGEILSADAAVRLDGPNQAARLGIATVFQELSLFPSRTVAENVFAGQEPTRLGLVDARALRRRAEAVLGRLGATHIDPRGRVADLSLADRQLVEIGKALAHEPRVLILDEGTSALARPEVVKLFDLLRRLKAEGLAILFISHRMPEIREIADRMTVFRDGRDVASGPAASLDEHRVVELMLGRSLARALDAPPPAPARTGAVALKVEGLSVPGRLADVGLEVKKGEVFGLAGLEGQGQADLLLALFGAYRGAAGSVAVEGRPVRCDAPWRAKRAGLALVPAERKTAGLLLPRSVRENVALPNLGRLSRGIFVAPARERARAAALGERLGLKTVSVEAPASSLSGGNQQKVVIAKWLEADPSIFLLNDPTRGIDVGAKAAIYDIVRELAAAGKAVILYSTELAELTGLCGRVAVMDRGRILRVLEGEAVNEDDILRTAVGLSRASWIAPRSPAQSHEETRQDRVGETHAILPRPGGRGMRRAPRLPRAANVPILLAGLAVLLAYYWHRQPMILSPFGLRTLADGATPLALAGVGQLGVVLTGGVDLSIGGVIGLCNCVAATLFGDGPVAFAGTIAATLAVGVGCGLVNGALVAALRLPPIVVTLATGYVFHGVGLYVRPAPGGHAPTAFRAALTGITGEVPHAAVLVLVAVGLLWRTLARTRLGQGLYAVGDNEGGAYLSGIPVGRVLLLSYALSGLFAALCGLFLTAQTSSGDASVGAVYTLGSIAAAVLGGAALSGGRGSALGTVLAAALLSVLLGVLFAAGVSTFYQAVFQGGILLAVLMIGNLHLLRTRSWVRFIAAD